MPPARGFAVVTTDTGHRGEVFDASFMAEQQASLDFAYQAVGRVAVLAKQILAQHYSRPPRTRTSWAARPGFPFDTGWSRLFLVPGMGHCGGGPATLDSFDMLGAVVDWVENQKPPQAIRATGRSFPGRSRPLCAYPKHAHYEGTGDVEDAASFECR
jgi:hypothetical protein